MNVSQWWDWFQLLLPGLWVSLRLILAVVIVGTPIALLLAMLSRSESAVGRSLSVALIEFGRGVPALVALYLVYFGLPEAGLTLGTFVCATISLSLNYAAYTSEVFRSALGAVPQGQWEASFGVGLTRAVAFRKVILPQATRVATPPMISWIISFFQATSLAFVIAVPELMSRAYELASTNFRYMEVFILAGVMYALIGIPGSRLVAVLEARNDRARI